jgi:hypothetical protein
MMRTKDLNLLSIPTDCSQGEPLQDYGTSSGTVEVVFRNLERRLVREIFDADLVVGCVAWLTNERILDALSMVRTALVVQKEDWLRPDSNQNRSLKKLYSSLRAGPPRFSHTGLVATLSCGADCTLDPVRCVGNVNTDKNPAHPRMHNKFFVFCRMVPEPNCERHLKGWAMVEEDTWPPVDLSPWDNLYVAVDAEGAPARGEFEPATCECDLWEFIQPYAVWTGSFNPTHNGTMSLENAVIIYDDEIAGAYYREWQQIEALSEPLDWNSPWVAPEWRIGT